MADFESVSLCDALSLSRLNFMAPAFFSCLGVLVYLSQESVQAIFQLVASFPQGSELVFTFSQGGSSSEGQPAEPSWAEAAAAVGEPWRTYYEPDSLRHELLRAGFSGVSFLTPEEARSLYYCHRRDTLPPLRRASDCPSNRLM